MHLERELAALEDAAAAVGVNADAIVVTVEGPPGSGKTALLEAFATRARDAGHRVKQVTCYAVGAGPFEGLPETLAQPSLPQLLTAGNDEQTFVLLVDDAQWADLDAALLLRDALLPPTPPVLVVMATRCAPSPRGAFRRALETPPVGGYATRTLSLTSTASAEVDLDTQLADEARAVLALLAVAGRPLGKTVLAAASAIALDGALATLEEEQLIREHSDGLALTHGRLGAAVLAELDGDQERSLHAALGEALAANGASPAVLAAHFEAAGQTRRAGRYDLDASEAAQAAGAHRGAAHHLGDALDLIDDLSPADHLDLVERYATLLADAGQGLHAAAAYLEVRNGVHVDQAARRRSLELRAAEQLFLAGEPSEALGVAAPLLKQHSFALRRNPALALTRTLWNTTVLEVGGARFSPTEAKDCLPDDLERLDHLLTIARGATLSSAPVASALLTDAIREALVLGEPRRAASSLAHLAVIQVFLGRQQRANKLLAQARKGLGDAPHPATVAWLELSEALVAFGASDLVSARERLQALDGPATVPWVRAIRDRVLGPLLLLTGRYDELWTLAVRLDDQRARAGDRFGKAVGATLLYAAGLMLGRSDVGELRRCAEAALEHRGPAASFDLTDSLFLSARTQALCVDEPLAAFGLLEQQWKTLRRSGEQLFPPVRLMLHGLRASVAAAASTQPGAETNRLLRVARRSAAKLNADKSALGLAMKARAKAALASSEDSRDAVVDALLVTAVQAEASGMAPLAAAARLRRATVLGEDTADHAAALQTLGVTNAELVAKALVPLATI